WLRDWINRGPNTFVQLEDGADPAKVRSKIKDFITPYLATANYGSGNHVELGLQKYTDMYLNSTFKNGLPEGGRIEYVRLFTIIAVFILLIACINFMNLATARSVKRAKEVGIRKTIGAIRRKLIVQFIGEAMLFTFFAVLISLAFVFTSLPYFNNFTNKQIQFPFLSFSFWLDILALLCITGFVAGSYPAMFLSSLNPVKVLKGSLRFSSNALLFRKGLVVIQFVVSIALIIGTIVVSQQVNFVQTTNLGYDKENLVYIPFQGDLGNRYETFKQQLLILPGVTAVDISAQAPSDIDAHVYDLEWQGKDPNTRIVGFHNGVGYDYAQTVGLQLINGRFFSRAFPSDTSHTHPNLVINETLAKILGFKNPIGQHMQFFGSIGTIIGVVKDYHFKSLHESIQPLVLYEGEGLNHGYALIKIEAGRTQQVIAGIEQIYKQLEANYPFRYYFADDEYRKLYSSEIAVRKLSDGFSFFAIFISSLGLLGLSIFTAEQRRKEIGVRKVIGASVTGIITMLSTDIVKLVLIATVIASPLSWFALNIWLQGFAYRINISWWIFVIAGIAALLIALLTISWQAIKAALANPVMSLRTE
ncbi:MAG TPA: FtsX-like permease family protein, partial [Puia sp.]|nr:FtsX-like permease family protein [Puia sp.]